MKPSKWTTPSGKVHWRRLRLYVRDAPTPARPEWGLITLCGSRSVLKPAADDAEVDCKVCLAAARSKGHLPVD